jgi:HD-GYP domain-containing protein (c-di-GMP phosphodiesterase class II)
LPTEILVPPGALQLADALDELRVHRATQFDPRVVDSLLALHADPRKRGATVPRHQDTAPLST